MNSKHTLILVAAVALVGGAIILKNTQSGAADMPATSQAPSPAAEPATNPATDPATSPAPSGPVKEFSLEANNFAFAPNEIKVKQGDTVKLTVKNTAGFHDWVVDEFNARTKRLQSGQSETIQFVVDKTGTFEFYCSVGSHRAMGMKGNLIVE